ncbi:NifB/NifX family molybdenum-iron cluster-binding protein [Youxingia wuxianensis]|uniref:NifB/NifX family molybdenum-iron cluster-binding protein n=1 Tax=Youxingia wuxianensis TaxID=2763678 RepID=A0A926EQT0_9FIRM|nr:NifB/NifX family molybdenum-iron cluster-binding protein [Youxingia wuxianensis]MBC8584590.1 NifB/NifX family molybdenum-iron cluster-binding protein [Youxingia wuxianensis]
MKKIAVTYENGQVFQHFGHCKQFKIYEVQENKIIASNLLDAGGSGHGALADFLKSHGVDVLICGGIGSGAKTALSQAGISFYPGAAGGADEQVAALLAGTLRFDPDTVCSHHHEGHGQEEGHCHGHGTDDKCGSGCC